MRTRLVAACIALSCGAPQRVQAPEPTLEIKTYEPFAMKADAKAPHQAVILGSDATDRSTILPLPATPGTATVDAVLVTAGFSPVKLATAPSNDGSLHVSLDDGGPSWRAGVWMAAYVAATTLGKDLTDLTFSATGGTPQLDGSSSSALIAAGFLAATTGTAVDPTTTILGVIHPDGTIGAVPDLAERVSAALARGKTRIGYPSGMRKVTAANGKIVDVVVLAKRRGAAAVEVADVHAAYKLLTGAALPAPAPLDTAELAIDPATNATLEASYKRWQQRLAAEWGAILQLESAGRLPQRLVKLREDAKRYARSAERLHEQKRHAAARARMLLATVYATSANQIYDVLHHVQANKLDAALAVLAELGDVDAQAQATFATLAVRQPATVADHLQLTAALGAALRGAIFASTAKDSLATATAYVKSLTGTAAGQLGSDATADAVVAEVAPAILYVARAVAQTTAATEQLELGAGSEITYSAAPANLERIAASWQSVGAAGLEYVEQLLVAGGSETRVPIARVAPRFVVAQAASRLAAFAGAPKHEPPWDAQSLPGSMLSLAAGELALSGSAALIATYHAPRAAPKTAQRSVPADGKALASTLANAERAARAHARAARIATGAVPLQAKLAYQLATAVKPATRAERLDALAQLWTASLYSQLAIALARN